MTPLIGGVYVVVCMLVLPVLVFLCAKFGAYGYLCGCDLFKRKKER